MLALALLSILAGSVIGGAFRVYALLPVTILLVVATAVLELAAATDAVSIGLTIVIEIVALQIGYLGSACATEALKLASSRNLQQS